MRSKTPASVGEKHWFNNTGFVTNKVAILGHRGGDQNSLEIDTSAISPCYFIYFLSLYSSRRSKPGAGEWAGAAR